MQNVFLSLNSNQKIVMFVSRSALFYAENNIFAVLGTTLSSWTHHRVLLFTSVFGTKRYLLCCLSSSYRLLRCPLSPDAPHQETHPRRNLWTQFFAILPATTSADKEKE